MMRAAEHCRYNDDNQRMLTPEDGIWHGRATTTLYYTKIHPRLREVS